MDNVDWESAPAFKETHITSAICDPANGSEIEEGTDEIPGRWQYFQLYPAEHHPLCQRKSELHYYCMTCAATE